MTPGALLRALVTAVAGLARQVTDGVEILRRAALELKDPTLVNAARTTASVLRTQLRLSLAEVDKAHNEITEHWHKCLDPMRREDETKKGDDWS